MIDLILRRQSCVACPASRLFLTALLATAFCFVGVAAAQVQEEQSSQIDQQAQQPKPVRPIHIVPFTTNPPKGNGYAPQIAAHLDYYGGYRPTVVIEMSCDLRSIAVPLWRIGGERHDVNRPDRLRLLGLLVDLR